MDGGVGTGFGVALLSGSGIFGGDRIVLASGARTWRIRIPSSQESEANIIVIEYKSGAKWFVAADYEFGTTSA